MAATIPNSLPFYTTTAPQLNRVRWCNGALLFRHAFPVGEIPAFVIKKGAATGISQILMIPVENETTGQIDLTTFSTSDLATEGSAHYEAVTFSIATSQVVYPGNYLADPDELTGAEPTLAQYCASYSGGPFYLRVVAGASIQYSEIFYMEDVITMQPDELCNHIKITWTDGCAIGELRYDLIDHINTVYLPVDVGRPEYSYEERGQEDGNNQFTAVWQKTKKRNQIEALVPEYLTDAMALIPMHATVTITDQYGDAYTVEDIEFDVSWETACYGRMNLRYSHDYTVKRCC